MKVKLRCFKWLVDDTLSKLREFCDHYVVSRFVSFKDKSDSNVGHPPLTVICVFSYLLIKTIIIYNNFNFLF